MLGIVDTLLVARLGPEALAGVGAAIQIMFFVISALSATSVGANVLVAQAVGGTSTGRRLELREAGAGVERHHLHSARHCRPVWPPSRLIAVFGMEPEVTEIGADYLRVTMGTVVVLSLMFLSSGVMRGAGDSRTPMLVVAVANVINIFLTYGLIFGEFGLPELGAVGSAWATFISRAIGFLILMVVLYRGVNGVSIRGRARLAAVSASGAAHPQDRHPRRTGADAHLHRLPGHDHLRRPNQHPRARRPPHRLQCAFTVVSAGHRFRSRRHRPRWAGNRRAATAGRRRGGPHLPRAGPWLG